MVVVLARCPPPDTLSSVLAICTTTIWICAWAVSAVAWISVVPFATAVTNPAGDTVAVLGFVDCHVTAGFAIACPCWSSAVTVSWTVAATAVSVVVGAMIASALTDALGAVPDRELAMSLPDGVRAVVEFGRPPGDED